jgi:hypothetical protein
MVLGSLSINPGYLVVGAGSFHSTLRFSLAAKGLKHLGKVLLFKNIFLDNSQDSFWFQMLNVYFIFFIFDVITFWAVSFVILKGGKTLKCRIT